VNPTRDNAVGDTGFEPVPLPGQRSISAWEFRRVWGLEPVQGRLCLPPCGVVGRLEQASQRARGRCRIVAVPKALLRTRALSRQWSPPVGGPTQFVVRLSVRRSAAGVSGLELAEGVSVAVSAEIRLSADRVRAMSSRISTRFAPAMAPRIAVTSPISRTPPPRRRSYRTDQPLTTELFTTEEG
jgi:hypothetical protein